MKITHTLLTQHHACADEVALFRVIFPNGAPMTASAAAQARQAGLDVSWLAKLLADPARAAYRAEADALWAAHEAQVDALRAAHEAQVDALMIEALRGEQVEG